jgi:hypothetical protein
LASLAFSASSRCLLENLESQNLGLLQGAAEIPVSFQDDAFAFDLVLRRPGHLEKRAANVIEAIGDIATRDLHPGVDHPLPEIERSVIDLVDHPLGVVTDRIERLGDVTIALADLHRFRLPAHQIVEDGGLRQRARDDRDPVLVEVRYLVQEGIDRHILGTLGHEPEVAERIRGTVEILHRRSHDHIRHETSSRCWAQWRIDRTTCAVQFAANNGFGPVVFPTGPGGRPIGQDRSPNHMARTP